MNIEPAVLYAAATVVFYLLLAKRFRQFAFRARAEALSRAHDLLVTEDIPENIREDLCRELDGAPGPLAPWVMAVMVIPSFIESLATKDSHWDVFSETASESAASKMDCFVNAALAGVLFRSPAATFLVLVQGVLIILLAVIVATPSLIRETLSRMLGRALQSGGENLHGGAHVRG